MLRFPRSLFALIILIALPAVALAQERLRVGVYAGAGTSEDDRQALAAALKADAGLEVVEVTTDQLAGLKVLVIGGGSGTKIGEGLGFEGGKAVQAFVRGGGGYVGIGAGAYVGARGYNEATRNLELVDASLVDRPGWKIRGDGDVVLKLTPGQPLGALPTTWAFSKGPLFAAARGLKRVPYVRCASFVTDLNAGDEDQAGIMPGTDAIVAAPYGKGRALLLSVLAHSRADTGRALGGLVRWAAGQGALPKTEAPKPTEDAIKVAILDDEGCIGGCISETFVCFDDQKEQAFFARRVNAVEVRGGALTAFDVVMLPGGSANKQTRGLQEAGRKAVREFVAAGGGYVGICAGAYMGASEPKHYGLGLASVRCADTKHWRRGGGQPVDVSVTQQFRDLTGRKETKGRIFYMNGPLLEEMQVEGLPKVQPLLRFVSDIHDNDAPAGVMPGKLAGLKTVYKAGRVVLFSVHPELTYGHEGTVVKSVIWAAKKSEN